MSLRQKWNEFRPTKLALAWTAVGASVLTMVVGFTWGGWATGSTARSMAEDAAEASHAELAAAVCVENLRHSNEPRLQLAELVELAGFRQRRVIEEAEWAVLPSGQELGRSAASLCAERVAAIDPEELPASMAATDGVEATESEAELQ